MAYKTVNPYTEETVAEFADLTPDELETKLATAHAAFLEWRDKPVSERVEVLAKVAELLKANREDYAKTLTLEMGKIKAEAEGEVDLCIGMLEYYVEHGPALLLPKYIAAKGFGDRDVQIVNEPMGVILAVEPWNFPYYQVIRITAPQLTAGNVVVLKHASNVPQCAARMEQLFRDAGAPEGLLTNLYLPHNLTETVVSDPRVRGVALTGSEKAGALVAGLAAKYLKKSTLELGGADAFVVLDDADVDQAAKWAAYGRNWNAGQVCVSSKRLIVVDAVYDRFLEVYREAVKNFVAGDPNDPATTLAPMCDVKSRDHLQALVDHAVEQGATAELLGNPVPEHGAFFQPVLLTNVAEDSDAFHTEFFGPVAQLYRAKDEEDAIRIANDSPFGLGGSVFSQNRQHARLMAERLDTGMVSINHPTIVAADIPFGGVKNSGYGHELTELGLKEFVNQKVIAVGDINGI